MVRSGWVERNNVTTKGYKVEDLSNAAKREVNLGAVTSEVKVDGKPIAKLDEVTLHQEVH